jgi:4-hydroxythreonine-4-phosphate dehydrogenase
MTQFSNGRTDLPRIVLAMGDGAGVGAELAAKLLADREITGQATVVAIGDARVLDQGARTAGVALDLTTIKSNEEIPEGVDRPIFIDLQHLDPGSIKLGVASFLGGKFALENFKAALAVAASGQADAVAFTPFNKSAMRLAHPAYQDENVFVTEMLNFVGTASEFNILPNLWNARVTSHVPLSGVAELITQDRILNSLRLTHSAMLAAGHSNPRIAVAALNPHAGDNGNFGHEETDVIDPAIRLAQAEGIICEGAFPSDTVFVRARKGNFDAVLTMYHDQGQIAMKLIGFDEGVTLLGGFPFPIVTPAHGSAYDIAGKGIANPGASRQAMLLAIRLSLSKRATKGQWRVGNTAAQLQPLRQ